MATDNEVLLRDVESMKNMMVARATGESTSGDECLKLQSKLMKHPVVTKPLSRAVHLLEWLHDATLPRHPIEW